MPPDILDEARLFLVNSMRGRQNESESRHPWRRGWEFAILHSLRVESYVKRILVLEEHSLSEEDVILIRLAAILHDAGRLEKREGHAKLGAEIAQKWLGETSVNSLTDKDVEKVVEMIADHSNKAGCEPDYPRAVLKDADTLDEIGMMSIFMAANWVNVHSPFFFHELRQRLVDAEIPYCERKLEEMNTRGASEILQQRKAFLENFIAQTNDELQADAYIEQMLLEMSKDGTVGKIDGRLSDG
jgi:HD superfamily phosphodiesterase